MHDPIVMSQNRRATVVEDDAVTREFLVEALERAGWTVFAAASLAVAVREHRQGFAGLLLCDVRLPDGDAFMLAEALALGNRAGRPDLYAIALSAEVDHGLRSRLLDVGYDAVLAKPLRFHELQAALGFTNDSASPVAGWSDAGVARGVRETPTSLPCVRPAILDDHAALEACGNAGTVQSLRELLAEELPGCLEQLGHARAACDSNAVREILHRLRSASGFCGATALGQAVRGDWTDAAADDQRLTRVLREGHALLELLVLRRPKQ